MRVSIVKKTLSCRKKVMIPSGPSLPKGESDSVVEDRHLARSGNFQFPRMPTLCFLEPAESVYKAGPLREAPSAPETRGCFAGLRLVAGFGEEHPLRLLIAAKHVAFFVYHWIRWTSDPLLLIAEESVLALSPAERTEHWMESFQEAVAIVR